MTQIIFATGNAQKFAKGQSVCQQYDIELLQQDLDVDEVQSEDTEYVARRKAEAAFTITKQPVIISDDAWIISGLNGFPGTYAKSVNTWFSAEDYVRLTKDLTDRKVSLIQTLVYQSADQQQLFHHVTDGVLLKEPRGTAGVSLQKVISLEPDGKTSISEMIGSGTHYPGMSTMDVWHDLAKWLSKTSG